MSRSLYKFKDIQKIKEIAEILDLTFDEAKELVEVFVSVNNDVNDYKRECRIEAGLEGVEKI